MKNSPPFFGPKRFEGLFECRTYWLSFTGAIGNNLWRLADHGFIADRACCWSDQLEDHEIAIVARTYCSDEEIDNPPDGLRCVRLPEKVLGKDPGTPIAIVIVGQSEAAESLLTACTSIPADMLAYAVSSEMIMLDWCVVLKAEYGSNFPTVRIVKIEGDVKDPW